MFLRNVYVFCTPKEVTYTIPKFNVFDYESISNIDNHSIHFKALKYIDSTPNMLYNFHIYHDSLLMKNQNIIELYVKSNINTNISHCTYLTNDMLLNKYEQEMNYEMNKVIVMYYFIFFYCMYLYIFKTK